MATAEETANAGVITEEAPAPILEPVNTEVVQDAQTWSNETPATEELTIGKFWHR